QSIRVAVPPTAATGPITVTTPAGSATSSGAFIVPPPAPVIDSFSPTTGSPGTMVTINGQNLGSASEVRFSGTNAVASPITVVSPQSIQAAVPATAATGPIPATTRSAPRT